MKSACAWTSFERPCRRVAASSAHLEVGDLGAHRSCPGVLNRTSPFVTRSILLRIGICLSLYWPVESGAERQARRQARELARRGHQVTVYTRRVSGRPVCERDGDVDIRRAIRTCDLGPLFGATFLTSLAWRLWRDRRQLDLVHCHQASWEAVAAGWIHRRTGLPTLVQPAAGGPYGEVQLMSQARGHRLVRSLILDNSHFVAISQQIERELTAWGVPSERLDRFGSGIDVDEFAPGESSVESQLPARPRAIFLGRLHPQKNLVVLLRAWQLVRRQCPTANLLLAGDGPQRQELEQLVDELQLNHSVHFLGALGNPQPYLQASDVFVLPSISEGMSNSLLEAMACGLPCVVSAAGGNVDLVQDGQAGLVADATTPLDLVNQLARMLNDSSLRQRCGAHARRIICQQYSIQSIVDRYEALYRQLVTRRDERDVTA
jgi:glycosyltransferase involved in cell wall biosynthesis